MNLVLCMTSKHGGSHEPRIRFRRLHLLPLSLVGDDNTSRTVTMVVAISGNATFSQISIYSSGLKSGTTGLIVVLTCYHMVDMSTCMNRGSFEYDPRCQIIRLVRHSYTLENLGPVPYLSCTTFC